MLNIVRFRNGMRRTVLKFLHHPGWQTFSAIRHQFDYMT